MAHEFEPLIRQAEAVLREAMRLRQELEIAILIAHRERDAGAARQS